MPDLKRSKLREKPALPKKAHASVTVPTETTPALFRPKLTNGVWEKGSQKRSTDERSTAKSASSSDASKMPATLHDSPGALRTKKLQNLEKQVWIRNQWDPEIAPDGRLGYGSGKTYTDVTQLNMDPDQFDENQIHVLGNNLAGSYIAHCLSGWDAIPPVRVLLHRQSHMATWETEGRSLCVVRQGVPYFRKRAQAELIPGPNTVLSRQGALINHLIVTVPCSTTVRAFDSIRHRIDNKTVICLVQDGLGVMEALNETHFPDPFERPKYVIGHLTHTLHQSPKRFYQVNEFKRGKLRLSLPHYTPGHLPEYSVQPPPERQERGMALLRLLVACPELAGVGFQWQNMLQYKLMSMAITSAVDTVAAVLDLPSFKLGASSYARNLLFRVLGEIAEVMLALPEMQQLPDLLDLIRMGELTRMCRNRLWDKKKEAKNLMRKEIALGRETDVDFLNGYFVERGKGLGIACPVNEMLIETIKAKVQMSKQTIEDWIPLDPRRSSAG